MSREAAENTSLRKHQRLRLRRTLLGLTGYGVAYCVLIAAFLLDQMAVSGSTLTIVLLTGLLVNGVFLALIVSNQNLRLFKDPSMTFLQVLVGLMWMLWAVWAAPEARGLMTLLIIPSFIFGVFGLDTRRQLLLTAFVFLGYGLIIFDHAFNHGGDLALGITYWLMVTAMLTWMAFVTGHVSRLRERLRQRNHDLEAAHDRLARLAVTDELTGLFNRRHMNEVLQRERQRALRNDHPFSLAILDLDHFKTVNDRYGHLTGDESLTAISERISQTVRDSDWVGHESGDALGRVGGEEFILLLTDTDAAQARQCAERIRRAICDQPIEVRGHQLRLSLSVGVASFRPDESLDSLHSRADRCLYRAKDQGRNQVVADADESQR